MTCASFSTACMCLLYLCSSGVVVAQLLALDAIVSLLFSATIVLTFVVWCLRAIRSMSLKDAFLMAIAFVAFCGIVIGAFLASVDVSAAYFKKFVLFVSSLVFLRVASDFVLSNFAKRVVVASVWVTIAAIVVLYFIDPARMYVYNGIQVEYLLLCFSNPNLTALFLTCFYMFSLAMTATKKGVSKKLFALLFTVPMLYFLFKTGSRNSLMAAAIFTVFLFARIFLKKKFTRISKAAAIGFVLYPITFFCLYVLFVDSSIVQSVFSSFADVGKGLDSRLAVWLPALDYFYSSPIFGAYDKMMDGAGFSQLHNSHLDALVSYGCVVLTLTCIFLVKLFNCSSGDYAESNGLIWDYGFGCALILGAGEAALFSGGLVFYVFVGLFLLMRNGEDSPRGRSEGIFG